MSRVLVIDDDEAAREALRTTLEQVGHEVLDLPSPIGATRTLVEHNIDVVVIDIILPGLHGDRLAKLLRGNPRFDRLGVVLISGNSNLELTKLAAEVGAHAVVPKADVLRKLAAAVAIAAEARSHGTG